MLQKWKQQDLAKSLVEIEKQRVSLAKQQGGVERESEMAKPLDRERISRKECLKLGPGWRLKVSSNETPICSDIWFTVNINS